MTSFKPRLRLRLRRTRNLALITLSLALAPLAAQANPFTTAQTPKALAPVRVSQPDPTLTRWQTGLRDALGKFFYAWKESRSPHVLLAVLGAAFLYGVLHATGPGHRKTVVFSIFIARAAPWWEPLLTGLLLAVLHAGASVVLMLAVSATAGAVSAKTGAAATVMEGAAYTLLLAMSLALLVRAIVGIARKKPSEDRAMGIGTLLLTGIYPCPGAILVLVLSFSLGLLGLGVMAVGAMSLGMSLPIIASGYLAWFGRTGLFMRAKKNERALGLVSGGVEIAGYGILLAFALFIDWPFLLTLPRVFS
jgi:nickel/cobalt transporter (NicO) family protein